MEDYDIREYLSLALQQTRMNPGLPLTEIAELLHIYFREEELEALIKAIRKFGHEK